MFELEKIDEYLSEANRRIHEVAALSRNLQKVYDILVEIKKIQENALPLELATLKREVSIVKESLEKVGAPKVNTYARDLDVLRRKLESDAWPLAIDPKAICKTEQQLQRRADNIIKLQVHDFLHNMRFLDFGCGQGYVTEAAAKNGAKQVVGYDICQDWKVATNDQLYLTTDPKEVRQKGPYDVILLFDVLDHLNEDPVRILREIRQVLSPNGKIYVRCHPWCSRHGTHLYEQVNKAYAHLIFDDMELTRIGGYSQQTVQKLKNPIETYRSWFGQANLDVRNEKVLRHEPEGFFTSPQNIELKQRIDACWDGDSPNEFISIEFVDYILVAADSNGQIF